MIEIIELDASHAKQAAKLAAGVFPYVGLYVRLSFWAYQHRESPVARRITRLAGVSSMLQYWAAVDENGAVCGVAGIYEYAKDRDEALWLAWFCVDPARRGQGIGSRLLAHSVEAARATGKKYFRLYTSTLPNEAAAQGLYEKSGFELTKEKNRLFYKMLYRELALQGRKSHKFPFAFPIYPCYNNYRKYSPGGSRPCIPG